MTSRHTPIAAVFGVVERKGKFLLQQRSATNYFAAGCYTLPGGHFEPGEDPAAAIIRELNEELGITIEPNACRVAGFVFEQQSGGETRIHVVCHITAWQGTPTIIEPEKHSEFVWASATALPDDTLEQARQSIALVVQHEPYRLVHFDPLVTKWFETNHQLD